jgi:hypothetical protein
VEGTNKAHEDGEAMGFVGVRLTAQLGRACLVRQGSVMLVHSAEVVWQSDVQ